MQVKTLTGSVGKAAFYDAMQATSEHRGWLLGTFITGTDGVALTEDFEIKWCTLTAGEHRDTWSAGPAGSAITIVLGGVHEFTVAPNGENGETVTQRLTRGMAIFWENSVPHKWRVIEDAETITIRRLSR